MRLSTLRELAARHGIALPEGDPDALYEFRDLEHFIEVFALVCSVLVDRDDFHRLAYEAVADAAELGIIHREMFFTPWFHLGRGIPFEVLWEGLAAGARDGAKDHGVSVGLVLDVDKPAGASHAAEMVELARGCDRELLLGIGGDDLEAGIDHRIFAPAWERARQLGFRTCIHAGEFSVDSIRAAVHELRVDRIDHGVLLVEDPCLLDEVVDRGVALTCCPTSDIEISKVWPSLDQHSYPELRRRGVLATLNSDDPALLRHDLVAEYRTVAEQFGFDLGEMERIALDGAHAAWLDDADRATLRARIEAGIESLRIEHGVAPRG